MSVFFHLLFAAGSWVDRLTTENLMKSTEKTVLVMLGSPGNDFHNQLEIYYLCKANFWLPIGMW